MYKKFLFAFSCFILSSISLIGMEEKGLEKLFKAVRAGNAEKVSALLGECTDLSMRDEKEGLKSLLMCAIPTINAGFMVATDPYEVEISPKEHSVDIMNMLLNYGKGAVLINLQDVSGCNALFRALRDYTKPLFICDENKEDYVKKVLIPLVQHGEDLDLEDNEGVTPVNVISGTYDCGVYDDALVDRLRRSAKKH